MTLWIHLLRHGIAVDHGDPGCPGDDALRYLTDEGRLRTRCAMTGWSKICEPRPTRVYASPYVRAQQTAVIASVILGLDPQEIAAHNGLVPHASAADALAPLGRDRSESILLVGHAPNLDLVLAALLGARQPLSRLKKSGLATVEIPRGSVSAGSGVLFALYSPGLLRRLEGLPP